MATPRRLFDVGSASAGPRRTARLDTAEPRPARRLVPAGLVRPRTSGRPAGLRVVLTRYLIGAVVLLAIVLLLGPKVTGPGAGAEPWRYQGEQVRVEGKGIFNILGRAGMGTTAWISRGSIERVRAVTSFNLLDLVVGAPTANRVSGWRSENGLALERSTKLAVLLLVVFGVVARAVPGRTWVMVVLLLLGLTIVLTKPQTTVAAASGASVAVPRAMVSVYDKFDPTMPPDPDRTPEQVQHELADEYWQSFVANPLSRMQTGTPVLSDAEPAAKPGILTSLRQGIAGVNDWAVGKRGWERLFISSTALAYVVPFSVLVTALAMTATAAQAVLFVLCLAGLVVIPIAVDRRRRPACFRYWLLPLLGTVLLLAASSLLCLAVMRLGQAVHRTDEYIGLLLAGSSGPVLLVLALRLVARRRRDQAAASSTGGTSS
jgi:hypothetical protein